MDNVTSIEQARARHSGAEDQGVAGLGYAAIEQVITATIVRVPAAAIDADRDAVGYKDYTHADLSYVVVNRKKSLHYLVVPLGTEVELLATPMECAAAVVRGDPGRIRSRFRARDRENNGAEESGSGSQATQEDTPAETADHGEE